MSLVVVDARGRCTIKGAKEGAYDAEFKPSGEVTLVPLVRATDRQPVKTGRVTKARTQRQVKGRDPSRIPPGTRLHARDPIGVVIVGENGRLSDGRSLNKTLTDAGITQNAWITYKLADDRTIGEAYDAGEWR